jgi:hypothetical protein
VKVIDKATARQLVSDYLKTRGYIEWVILDEHTLEKEDSWVFSITTRKHFETGDDRYTPLGIGPYIVNKSNGSVYTTGSLDFRPEDFDSNF